MKTRFLFIAASLLLALGVQARADVGSRYGYGSRSAALGGASVAWGADGYAAYSNPAALSSPETVSESTATDRRLIVSWGIMDLSPNFTPISQVVTENPVTSDKTTVGDVDQSYKATFGQILGLSYRLFPDTLNLSFGMTVFLPLEQLAYLDSGETYVPEYVLYRADTLRPAFDFGAGAKLGQHLNLGLGLHLAYSVTSNVDVFLQTDPTHPSSMRFSASQKVKGSPYFGALFFPTDRPQDWSIGAVLRLPLTSEANFKVNTAASILANFAALDFNFSALGALFYDPLTIELGTSIRHADWARLYLQLDYELYSKYQAPTLTITNPAVTNCQGSSCGGGIQITPGQNTAPSFKNILVPRIGEEIELSGKTTLRAGYARRPSIIDGVPTGIGNMLDPGVNMFNAGLGFHFSHFLSYEVPCTLDLNLAYQLLDSFHVTKTPGDESGNASGTKIGSPGYDAGGDQFGGGASLTIAF
jgi:hypothetical protein